MKITTTRFGEISVAQESIIEMRGRILGFEHLQRYAMLVHDEKTPFLWFQSVEDGATAFVVINPQLVKADYEPLIPDEWVAQLAIAGIDDVVLMAIVTIRSTPLTITANLRAPLVINARKKLAAQIILDDQDFPIQYDIVGNKHREDVIPLPAKESATGIINALSQAASR